MSAFTKLYLTNDGSYPHVINGTISHPSGWSTGASNGRQAGFYPHKRGVTSPTTFSLAETSATAGLLRGVLTGYSPPLLAQNISGTVNVVIGVRESAADADFYWACEIWIAKPDGTIRSTLVDNYAENTTNEWPTTSTGAAFQSAITLTAQDCEAGDRIGFMLGYVARNATATSKTGTINFGAVSDHPGAAGTALSDLTVGSTNVTTEAGYVEFSNAIDFVDAPTNITCAAALDITAELPYNFVYHTETIATDDGEHPSCASAGKGYYRPIWLKFTAPSTGIIYASTFDGLWSNSATVYGYTTDSNIGSIGTVIAAYTGSCGSLSQIACVQQTTASDAGAATTFNVTAGTTYFIRVAAYDSAGGPLPINVKYVTTPSNDNFASAIAIDAEADLPYESPETHAILATMEASESKTSNWQFPSAANQAHSVWWTISSTTEKYVRISVPPLYGPGISFLMGIAVWTGSTVSTLTEVASKGYDTGLTNDNDDVHAPSIVLRLEAGITYRIQVIHRLNRANSFVLSVEDVNPPANVKCADAIAIGNPTLVDFTDSVDYQWGTPSLPTCIDSLTDWEAGRPMWYTWVADVSGLVQVQLAANTESVGGVAFVVYSGGCGALSQVACAAYRTGAGTGAQWTATLGTTYHILVLSMLQVEQTVSIEINGAATPPPAPTNGAFTYTVDNSTREFGPPFRNGAPAHCMIGDEKYYPASFGWTDYFPLTTIGDLPDFPDIPAGRTIKLVWLYAILSIKPNGYEVAYGHTSSGICGPGDPPGSEIGGATNSRPVLRFLLQAGSLDGASDGDYAIRQNWVSGYETTSPQFTNSYLPKVNTCQDIIASHLDCHDYEVSFTPEFTEWWKWLVADTLTFSDTLYGYKNEVGVPASGSPSSWQAGYYQYGLLQWNPFADEQISVEKFLQWKVGWDLGFYLPDTDPNDYNYLTPDVRISSFKMYVEWGEPEEVEPPEEPAPEIPESEPRDAVPCCVNTGPSGTPPPGPGSSGGPGTPLPPIVLTPIIIPPDGADPPLTYTPCEGGGTVPSVADPTEGMTFGLPRSPLVHIQWELDDDSIVRKAKLPINTPTREPIDNGVLDFSTVTYSLADRKGNIRLQTLNVKFNDNNGAIREMLAIGANRFIVGRKLTAYIEDDADRRTGDDPFRLVSGLISSDPEFEEDLSVTIPIADELGYRYSPISIDRRFPLRTLRPEMFPNLPSQFVGMPVPIIYGELSDEIRITFDPPQVNIPYGVVPTRFIGIRQLTPLAGGAAEDWDAYLVCGHAIAQIPAWFASNLHADSTLHGSVRMTSGTASAGGEFLIPGYSNWDLYFSTPYNDITDTYGNTERYTIIYARGGRSDEAVSGGVPITVNVCGIEDEGDGSGTLITDIAYQSLHFINAWLLNEYTTGLWPAIPVHDSVPKIRASSFENVKDIHDARIEGGYPGAWGIFEQATGRDILADIQISGDMRFGFNNLGQIIAFTLDETQSLSGLTVISDTEKHFNEGTFKIRRVSDEIENVLPYMFGPEPATGRVIGAKQFIASTTSIENYLSERRASDILLRCTYNRAMADDVMVRYLLWSQDSPTYVTWDGTLEMLKLRVGQLIQLKHRSGIGQYGWTDRILLVTQLTTNPNEAEFSVNVLCEDVHAILVHLNPDGSTPETIESSIGFQPMGSSGSGTTMGDSTTGYRMG